MFTWGFVRSNFFLPILVLPLLARNPGNDLLGDLWRDLGVGVELHRAVRSTALGARAQFGRIAEELRKRHQHPDRLEAASLVDAFDPPAPSRDVAHHVTHELLGSR